MTDLRQAAQAAAELIELDVDCLAALAKMDQLDAVDAAEAAGDSFAAYWAGSVSASVEFHRRRGAIVTIKTGRA